MGSHYTIYPFLVHMLVVGHNSPQQPLSTDYLPTDYFTNLTMMLETFLQ